MKMRLNEVQRRREDAKAKERKEEYSDEMDDDDGLECGGRQCRK